jgi:hypothetical protein
MAIRMSTRGVREGVRGADFCCVVLGVRFEIVGGVRIWRRLGVGAAENQP